MEDFTGLLVSKIFIPLVVPVQPHSWEVFDWSKVFGKPAGAQAIEQACQDADAIGVFEL